MREGRIYIGGELYLSLETVAEIYRVETVWLQEAVDAGLIDAASETRPIITIAATRLDHVATVVRLRSVFGDDVEVIRLALVD